MNTIENNPQSLAQTPDGGALYRICLGRLLQRRWHAWFDGLTVTLDKECGETVLTGWLADQSALHGVLAQIRDLNLPLISVTRLKDGADPSNKE